MRACSSDFRAKTMPVNHGGLHPRVDQKRGGEEQGSEWPPMGWAMGGVSCDGRVFSGSFLEPPAGIEPATC
jgi:hypothetical protein